MFLNIDSSSGFTVFMIRKGTEITGRRKSRVSQNLFIPSSLWAAYSLFLRGYFPRFPPLFGSFDVKRLETFFGQTICSCNAMGYFLTPPVWNVPIITISTLSVQAYNIQYKANFSFRIWKVQTIVIRSTFTSKWKWRGPYKSRNHRQVDFF